MDKANNRKIKNFLIMPQYQVKYTFFIAFTGLCLVSMLAYISYSYLRENYISLIEISPMSPEARVQLLQELKEIILYLAISAISFIAFVALTGLTLSHRVAGPMYHFQKVFKQIIEGNHEARIHLRPDDEFKEVAQTFNEMMDSIKKSSKS